MWNNKFMKYQIGQSRELPNKLNETKLVETQRNIIWRSMPKACLVR